jgi:hypothetical protein
MGVPGTSVTGITVPEKTQFSGCATRSISAPINRWVA